MSNRSFLIIFLICLGFSACDSKQVFDAYKSVPNQWNKNNIITFDVTPPDSVNVYNLFVNIRNTNSYKYDNLFLIVEMNFPHGKTITDTLEYKMAEPSGKLLGTGFSDIKENKLWYKEHITFNESGIYKVNIRHAMRNNGEVYGVDNLEGITDIGFRIEPATN